LGNYLADYEAAPRFLAAFVHATIPVVLLLTAALAPQVLPRVTFVSTGPDPVRAGERGLPSEKFADGCFMSCVPRSPQPAFPQPADMPRIMRRPLLDIPDRVVNISRLYRDCIEIVARRIATSDAKIIESPDYSVNRREAFSGRTWESALRVRRVITENDAVMTIEGERETIT